MLAAGKHLLECMSASRSMSTRAHPAATHLGPNAEQARLGQAAAVDVMAEEHVGISPHHRLQVNAPGCCTGSSPAVKLLPPPLVRGQSGNDLPGQRRVCSLVCKRMWLRL